MPSLNRLRQLAIVEEATEGTVGSPFSAANAKFFTLNDLSFELDAPLYNRNIRRSTLTPLQGLSGIKTSRMRFSLELTGCDASSVPQVGLPLRACGFRQEELIKLTISTITSGPFLHGETVTQTTSGATGTVVRNTYTGQTDLWVAVENGLGSGTFTTTGGHTLTGGTSGATCAAPSAITGTHSGGAISAPAGIGWWPQSYSLSRIYTDASGIPTNAITEGQLLKGDSSGAYAYAHAAYGTGAGQTTIYIRRESGHFATAENVSNGSGTVHFATHASAGESQFQIPSLTMGVSYGNVRESMFGARGTVSFSGNIGEPMIANFEFRGAFDTVADAGEITGVTYPQRVPPVLLDADLQLGESATTFANEVVQNITSIQWAMNNDIQFRQSMSEASGLLESMIVNRNPTGSFDPEMRAESIYDFVNQFSTNAASRLRMNVGTSALDKFLISMPGVTWTSLPPGERNGLNTRQVNFQLHGGSQNVSSSAADNEVVLIWQAL